MRLFRIYDSKAETYGPILEADNSAVAIRMVQRAVDDESSEWSIHAEDYSLWEVGETDRDTASISPTTPSCLIHLHELRTQNAIKAVG